VIQSQSIQRPLSIHHERTRSYDPPKTFRSPDRTFSPAADALFHQAQSRGSLNSHGSGGLSRHSSLTSPVLRRLSQKSVVTTPGDGSVASVASVGSAADLYVSAASSVCSLTQAVSPSGPGGRLIDNMARPLLRGAGVRSPDSDMASSLSSHYSNAVEYFPGKSAYNLSRLLH